MGHSGNREMISAKPLPWGLRSITRLYISEFRILIALTGEADCHGGAYILRLTFFFCIR